MTIPNIPVHIPMQDRPMSVVPMRRKTPKIDVDQKTADTVDHILEFVDIDIL